jgi:hypothetical protein
MIRQVVTNLLSNAIKFSAPVASPRVEVGSQPGDRENEYTVRDNGVGFDMQYAHKLFGVFQRLHSVTEFDGTGVGLAIVERVVRRHGGRVWAESEEGKGATFHFSLPRPAETGPDAEPARAFADRLRPAHEPAAHPRVEAAPDLVEVVGRIGQDARHAARAAQEARSSPPRRAGSEAARQLGDQAVPVVPSGLHHDQGRQVAKAVESPPAAHRGTASFEAGPVHVHRPATRRDLHGRVDARERPPLSPGGTPEGHRVPEHHPGARGEVHAQGLNDARPRMGMRWSGTYSRQAPSRSRARVSRTEQGPALR